MSAMDVGKPRTAIGRRHAEVSVAARRLARWSAGAAVATWAFAGLDQRSSSGGLFASLNTDARTGLACLAQVPIWIPLVVFAFALQLNYGSFYTGVREALVSPDDPYRISGERGVLVNRLIKELPRGWRRWQVFGWWLTAGLAGAATVAVTGALLRNQGAEWLVWALVAVCAWVIAKLEVLMTTWRYREIIPPRPKDPEAALRRAREWRELRPGDTSAMPWIYAYSGLSTAEIEKEFAPLATSGPIGFTAKLLGLVAVVLFYSLLPAPDVSHLAQHGLTGCLFDIVHGFAGVAEENFRLAAIGAVIVLILMPVSVLIAYLRFMVRYHFPPGAIAQVLTREARFALTMPAFSIILVGVMAPVIALLLWASAALADAWDSPVAGTVVLVVPTMVIVWTISRFKTRGPLPR